MDEAIRVGTALEVEEEISHRLRPVLIKEFDVHRADGIGAAPNIKANEGVRGVGIRRANGETFQRAGGEKEDKAEVAQMS